MAESNSNLPDLTTSSSSSSKVCSPNPNIFGGFGDDILREILLRLPRNSLLSSRLVSTRWLEVTTDPFFVRSYRSLHPPMLGFFYHHHRSDKDPPVFVPTAQSPYLKEAIDCVSPNLEFLPHQENFRLDDSCNGLLLLADPTRDCCCVCNPMTKEWMQLSNPPFPNRGLIGPTCSEKNPSSFHVVLVGAAGGPRRRRDEVL